MRSRTVPLLPRMGFFLLLGSASILASSCALLFPDRTAPKSANYVVTPPDSPWHKLEVGEDPNSLESLRADLAYENPSTGAIISINSLCRKYNHSTLEALTQNLVRGIDNRKILQMRERTLDKVTALDSLFEGVVDKVPLHIRTVVLIKNSCTYDFIYVVIPSRERDSGLAFDKFLASFRAD